MQLEKSVSELSKSIRVAQILIKTSARVSNHDELSNTCRQDPHVVLV